MAATNKAFTIENQALSANIPPANSYVIKGILQIPNSFPVTGRRDKELFMLLEKSENKINNYW